jgi:hypothetical protein
VLRARAKYLVKNGFKAYITGVNEELEVVTDERGQVKFSELYEPNGLIQESSCEPV